MRHFFLFFNIFPEPNIKITDKEMKNYSNWYRARQFCEETWSEKNTLFFKFRPQKKMHSCSGTSAATTTACL